MKHQLRAKPPSTLPRFSRLNYFYGQALGHHDFADEQHYFREKLRLHNRCLHGWGVICGLRVSLVEAPLDRCPIEQADATQPSTRPKIRVSPGMALDRHGRELILTQPLEVDLWASLSEEDRCRIGQAEACTVHVSLCYCEAPLHRVRPIVPDPCGPVADNYARILEGVKLDLRIDAEPIEESCNPCCEDHCGFDCVPLAQIVELVIDRKGALVGKIDERWRRNLARYEPVRVTGISWKHGRTYAPNSLTRLLGRADATGSERGVGLELQFSRPVRSASFQPGVFEVLRYSGGGAPAGSLAWIAFEPDAMDDEFVESVVYRQATNERWSPGDKILIRLRGDFVLDACNVALDGEHIGGRVPTIAGPGGPWTSGNGVPGGDFVSWIFAE